MIEFCKWYYSSATHEYNYYFCKKGDRIIFMKQDKLMGVTYLFMDGRSLSFVEGNINNGTMKVTNEDKFDRLNDKQRKQLIHECFEDD